MLTMYLAMAVSFSIGSLMTSGKVFKELLEVKRHVAFRTQFPDHPMTIMQSEELVAAVYDQKKNAAKTALKNAALPLTFPVVACRLGHKKLTKVNSTMAPAININHALIREEEGR